jgi:hypothetical protein
MDLGEGANAVATGQWADAQDCVLISEFCLDNDDWLLGTVLKRLDGAARETH